MIFLFRYMPTWGIDPICWLIMLFKDEFITLTRSDMWRSRIYQRSLQPDACIGECDEAFLFPGNQSMAVNWWSDCGYLMRVDLDLPVFSSTSCPSARHFSKNLPNFTARNFHRFFSSQCGGVCWYRSSRVVTVMIGLKSTLWSRLQWSHALKLIAILQVVQLHLRSLKPKHKWWSRWTWDIVFLQRFIFLRKKHQPTHFIFSRYVEINTLVFF